MKSEDPQRRLKVLCIQLKQLGDVLMTTPSVRALATTLPNSEIDFLTQKPANLIFEQSPYVRQVHCIRWTAREILPLLRKVRRQKYDMLIDFSGSSKTALFSWMTRIPRRIGYHDQRNAWCFTDRVDTSGENGYNALRKAALLSVAGIGDVDPALDFFVTDESRQVFDRKIETWKLNTCPLFAVSPVSKRAYKVWPADRFATICDRLVERYGGQIFFLVGPGEKHFAEAVKASMRHDCLPIVDDLDLYEAARLLDLSVCYVGNDNGLMHLAVARKRPTFAVFGKHNPRTWVAPIDWHQAIEHDPGCKRSCRYPECELECLTGIQVDQAWDELTTFLQHHTNLQG